MIDETTILNKLNELIAKHNDLARVIVDLSSAIDLINDAVFSNGEIPEKLDS